MQLQDMSFQDLNRNGGSGPRELTGVQNMATREVEGLVFRMANGIAQLKKLVEALGGPKDTTSHRNRLAESNIRIQELARNIKDKVTTLNQDPNASPLVQAKAKKLLQDFAAALQDYKAVQKIAAEKEAASLPRPDPSKQYQSSSASASAMADGESIEVVVEKQALLQQQKRAETAALDNAISYNEMVIEERDAGIAEIQRHIGEVNEMFQDLAVLIHDQGEQLETIDTQIESTAERVREGNTQLRKAERSQRSARSKWLCMWFVAGLIVGVLILVLLLQ